MLQKQQNIAYNTCKTNALQNKLEIEPTRHSDDGSTALNCPNQNERRKRQIPHQSHLRNEN